MHRNRKKSVWQICRMLFFNFIDEECRIFSRETMRFRKPVPLTIWLKCVKLIHKYMKICFPGTRLPERNARCCGQGAL